MLYPPVVIVMDFGRYSPKKEKRRGSVAKCYPRLLLLLWIRPKKKKKQYQQLYNTKTYQIVTTMPSRKAPKATRARKPYPKRSTVRSTVMQRAKTMEYKADPVPPIYGAMRSNKEQKFLDMAQVSQDCNSEPGPADIVLLNQIGQGTSVNTRIGMRYNTTGVHIRGQIRQVGVQNTSPPIAGYYIVYDAEPHATLATSQEIFNLRYQDVALAFPNGTEGQKGGRFKYLARKWMTMGNQDAGTTQVEMDGVLPGTRLIDDYIPLNKLPTQCVRLNSGSSITSIQKGALLLVPFGRLGNPISGTPSACKFDFTWRLYFNE